MLIARYTFLIEYHFGMRNSRPKFDWNRGPEEKVNKWLGRRMNRATTQSNRCCGAALPLLFYFWTLLNLITHLNLSAQSGLVGRVQRPVFRLYRNEMTRNRIKYASLIAYFEAPLHGHSWKSINCPCSPLELNTQVMCKTDLSAKNMILGISQPNCS